MPICLTCQGEYVRQECLCPACEKALAGDDPLCPHCGQQTGVRRLCPRCRSDVVAWENERLSLAEFIVLRGGFVGLLPTAAALALFVFWAGRGNSIHHPIASLFSIVLSLFVFYGLFSFRYSMREMMWAAQSYRPDGLSPTMLGVWALGLGMLGALVCFALYKAIPAPTEFVFKMIFAIVYVTTFVSLTTGLTIFVLRGYIADLDQRVPPPIFVYADKLVKIVLRTVAEMLPEEDENGQRADRAPLLRFEVIVVKRNAVDGGVRILAREQRFVRWQAPGALPLRPQWTEWVIAADRWGRLLSLQPRVSFPSFPPKPDSDEPAGAYRLEIRQPDQRLLNR